MALKNKAFLCSIFFVFLCFGSTCKQRSSINKNVIKIQNGSQPLNAMMYLNRDHWHWGMIVRENTLNDTALIGIMKVLPGKTGTLFKVDCFVDSIPFHYRPYKATKCKLVIEYFSVEY